MKKTNKYILLAVVVLSLLLVVLVIQRKYSAFRNDMNTFSVGDTSNVVKIFMSDKNNNTLLLERTGPYSWTVNGKYAGSPYNISMLLQTMLDIEVRNPVAKSAYDNTIRQLAVSSVKVEIYQRV